jgi:uncharacterized glyoxalase superfamily protein PhnB
LKVIVAGDVGTFEWDFVTTDSDGQKLRTPGCDLLRLVGDKIATAELAANRTAIIEFQIDDVEAEFTRLKDELEVAHEPKMMPWGNRAAQFRDLEGTLVSLYACHRRRQAAVRAR